MLIIGILYIVNEVASIAAFVAALSCLKLLREYNESVKSLVSSAKEIPYLYTSGNSLNKS